MKNEKEKCVIRLQDHFKEQKTTEPTPKVPILVNIDDKITVKHNIPIVNPTNESLQDNSMASYYPEYLSKDFPYAPTINETPISLNSDIPTYSDITQNSAVHLCDKLRHWIVEYKISHNSSNALLNILKSEGMKVPQDVRTLMKTPKTQEICLMSNGTYIHLGIENMLKPALEQYNINIGISDTNLKIGINIDGLPLVKSSKSQIWPILVSILNLKYLHTRVFPVGIFHGYEKPKSVEEFLNPFIIDILKLLDDGLCIHGVMLNLEISNIVCDAPAKSFLLNVKNHNGYFGCTSCILEGTYLQNRMSFLETNSVLRTDESFRKKLNDDYHKGDTPLLLLPINLTNVVCLDYMFALE